MRVKSKVEMPTPFPLLAPLITLTSFRRLRMSVSYQTCNLLANQINRKIAPIAMTIFTTHAIGGSMGICRTAYRRMATITRIIISCINNVRSGVSAIKL